MKLPLLAPKEEAPPSVLLDDLLPLPRVLALVDAGHPEALEGFVRALSALPRAPRVLRVTEGPFAIIDDTRARIDADTRLRLAEALGGDPVVTIGAVVPALFRPHRTLAFARTSARAAFSPAARSVAERFDAVLADARPALARNIFETGPFAT